MLPSERIVKKYPLLLKLLKFSIKNDKNPEYNDFYLVKSYIMILNEIENNLDEIFDEKVRNKNPIKFKDLLYSLFQNKEINDKDYAKWNRAVKRQTREFKKYIDTKEKIELVRCFELIADLTDMAIERDFDDKEEGGLWYLEEVDKEFNKIITYFNPILEKKEKE